MQKTRGAQLLRALLEDTKQEVFADRVSKRLGRTIHQATISSWSVGRNMPRGDALVVLQEIAGIPVGEWLRPADDEAKKPRRRRAA